MKQITELSEKEILALTDNQLNTMVQYKMAEEGIKILEYPNKPEFAPIPKKDDSAFVVGGLTYPLTNKGAAEEISKIMAKYREYFINTAYNQKDYSIKYLKPLDDYATDNLGKVSEEQFFKAETERKISEDKQLNKDIEQAYQVELAEYNEAYERRKEIESVIYGAFHEVNTKYADMERLKAKYEQYLLLAEDNAETAMKFLKNAYTVSYQAEYYVVGKEAPEIEQEITIG